MNIMENGVFQATKLMSEAKNEDQVINEATVLQIASILSIDQLNDYQEATYELGITKLILEDEFQMQL